MPDDDETPQVLVHGATDPAITVRLTNPQPLFDETTFTAAIHADGLTAQVDRVTITPWDQPQLAGFFTQLAADYTGWDATRTWRSNHLVIDAKFHSGGHVALTWTLRARHLTEDRWQASITTMVEAGEQMTQLAADIKAFLHLEKDH